MSNDPKNGSEQNAKQPIAAKPAQSPKASSAATVDKCKSEECKKKPDRFGFCNEHYEMYMQGVLRGDGSKPADHQEKLSWYLSKSKKAVA